MKSAAAVFFTFLFLASVFAFLPGGAHAATSQTYSYFIYKDASGEYYAKNLSSGSVEIQSLNASYLIQQVFNKKNLGTVKFDSTEFDLNWYVTVSNHTNLTVQGAGKDSTIIKATGSLGTNSFFKFTNVSYLTIKDLAIDVNKEQTETQGAALYFGDLCNNITIENIKAANSGHGKLFLYNTKYATIKDSEFYSDKYGDDGIIVDQGSEHVVIENNYIHIIKQRNGVAIVNASHVQIINNVINADHGIGIEQQGSDILIQDNNMTIGNHYAVRAYIFAGSGYGYSDVTIFRNEITVLNSTSGYGIMISSTANKNWNIKYNKIMGGEYSVIVDGKVTGLNIEHNLLIHNPYSAILIKNTYPCSWINITRNSFNAQGGVSITGASNININHNLLTITSRDGVDVVDSTSLSLISNIVRKSGGYSGFTIKST